MDAEHYDAARAEETFYLRQQLAEAAVRKPEYLRMEMTCVALRSNLSRTGGQFLLLPHEECLTAVYGPDGSRKFWRNYLSRTVSVFSFLRHIALMGAHNEQQEQVRWMALRAALRDAFDMGETWLVRGTSFEDENLKVIPRRAAEWLLHNPMRRHLLPPTLVAFLESGSLVERNNATPSFTVEPRPTGGAREASVEYRTGAEGRPTSRQLVEQEMRARASRGKMKPNLAQEAIDLAAWLKRAHPSAPPMTDKTIANRLRGEYRSLCPKL